MADKIICKHCGKENSNDTMYCYNCHEPLNENDPPLPILLDMLEGQ